MESKKSPGPSLAVVAGGAALVCAGLVGAAYFLRDDVQPATAERSSLAASALQSILARCDEEPTEDIVDGRTRTRCATDQHPSFLIDLMGKGDALESAKMLVPMGGTSSELLDRKLLGLEMFSALAGVQADVFLPKEFIDTIGTAKSSFVFQGWVYTTGPIAQLGIIFAVTPPNGDSELEK